MLIKAHFEQAEKYFQSILLHGTGTIINTL